MPRLNPYSLQMQITRLFAEGQSFFADPKVRDWLKDHNQDPNAYDIHFHQTPAPIGSGKIIKVTIELRRRDGQPVDAWLQAEVNRES